MKRLLTIVLLLTFSVGYAQTQPVSGPSPEIQALIAKLSDPDEKVRKDAMDKLVNMGDEARAALEAHLRGKTAADEALARIEANKVAGPTLITLKLDAAKGDEAIAALAKASGYELRPYNDQAWKQQRLGKVTIDADKQPFWSVFKDVCTQAGVGLYQGGNNDRIIRLIPNNMGGQNMMKYPASINGAFMSMATSIQRTSSVEFANPKQINRSLSLQLMAMIEPKVHIIQVSYTAEVDEAVDDKGNELVQKGNQGRNWTNSRGVMWNLNVPLQYPQDNAGTKITKLRGKVRAQVQTRSEMLEVPDPLTAKEITKDTAGRKVIFKSFKKTGSGQNAMYQAEIEAHRQGMDQQAFYEWMNNPNVKVVDAQGREYQSWGGGGSSSGEVYTRQMQFRRTRDEGGPQPGEPAKLIWEVPTAVQEVPITFEFSDLPLP